VQLADLLSRLRRLSHALPGDGVLHLPANLPATDAIQSVRAALKALESRTAPRGKGVGSVGGSRIFIDGAARGNPGPAGVGVLITGPDGKVVEEIHQSIGEATNNVAEYRALLLALDRARALGCNDIEIYSDSELLVRQLQGRYRVKHPALRAMHAKAMGLIAHFRGFSIAHVPREENAEADALANRGIEEALRPVRRGARSGPGAPRSGGMG
jgi:ribonuclease HI